MDNVGKDSKNAVTGYEVGPLKLLNATNDKSESNQIMDNPVLLFEI